MVGFGFMDNSILIRAGDAIDNSLGDTLGLTGLECAAIGQVFSDLSGVLFGGVLESVSRRFVLPPALSQAQHAIRITQVVGVAGAAIGVVIGCILGMGNLVFMDLKEQERQKKLVEVQKMFLAMLQSGLYIFDAGAGSIFVVNKEENTLWTFGATGVDSKIEVPLAEGSLVGWTAMNGKTLNIKDAYQDHRFNDATDKRLGRRTTSVLCVPIRSHLDNTKVIAVLQVMNKTGGFSQEDEEKASVIALNTAIFLSHLLPEEYGEEAQE